MPGSDKCQYCYWLDRLEACLKQKEAFADIPGINKAWQSVILECEAILNKQKCVC